MIALFGGTFDPVHFGHLRAAWEVKERLQTNDFRFLPAGVPPHKSAVVTPARHRLQMLKLALAGTPGFSIDQRELNRAGPSYMVDTLADLRRSETHLPLILIIGQDSANSLDRWHRWQDLFSLASLLVMNRPGIETAYSPGLANEMESRAVSDPRQLRIRTAGLVCNMAITAMPIAASGIRDIIAQGESPRFLLPASVLDYMQTKGLYKNATC